MEYPAGDPLGGRQRAGGKVDEPLVIIDSKGGKHTVANPGDKIVKLCDGRFAPGRILLPQGTAGVAGNGTRLTNDQTLASLKGGL